MGQLRQPFYFKVRQKLFQSEVETIISKWVIVCFKVGQKLFQSWAITSKWDKMLFQIRAVILTLFRMGFFGAAHGWEGGFFGPPFPKIRFTYPTVMKLGTVIPYLRKIQKMYKSRDKSLKFC